MVISPFHKARGDYQPRFPSSLTDLSQLRGATAVAEAHPWSVDPAAKSDLHAHFPHTFRQVDQGILELTQAQGPSQASEQPLRVGVLLSGGPAPGGHNVIWGLHDALTASRRPFELVGFLGGAGGLLNNRSRLLTHEDLVDYRNTGGFDLLGTGRTKIETSEQCAKAREVSARHELDALVIIGGDDSNTNAARLAEYFKASGAKTAIIGVPKTIDGDLKNRFIETTFGFDSAVRLYSELISNIARDALSGRKYYHFIRLMGRAASHITLECALQTQPTITLIAEEVAARQLTLAEVVEQLATVIKARASQGRDYGIILVPEGLIEFIPEMRSLIHELNHLLAEHKDYISTLSGFTEQSEYVHRKLTRDASYTFSSLPLDIQRQLLMDRDPHGNVALSRVETEKLLIELVQSHLKEEKVAGRYSGSFGYQHHFLGYEGRCIGPSNFDADYAYSLGRTAAALAAVGANGYMAVMRDLASPPEHWRPGGVPLLAMMTFERRHGQAVPVLRKGLVELGGRAFGYFSEHRDAWAESDSFRFTGPIQYFGPSYLTDRVPLSLALERGLSKETHW